MTEIVPTIGRIVLYVLSERDAKEITKLRNAPPYMFGSPVQAGDIFPAMVVRVLGDKPDSDVNLKVELDGVDNYWVTLRHVGEGPGTYHWMAYQKAVASGQIPPTVHAIQKS